MYKPFETMESLLMSISPMFRQKFQEALYNKLADINDPSNNNISERQGLQTETSQQPMSQDAIIALLNESAADPLNNTDWNMKNI